MAADTALEVNLELPSFAFASNFVEPNPKDGGPGTPFVIPKLEGQPAVLFLKTFGDIDILPRETQITVKRSDQTSSTFRFIEQDHTLTVSKGNEQRRSLFPRSAWEQVDPNFKDIAKLVLTDSRRKARPIYTTEIDKSLSVPFYPETFLDPKQRQEQIKNFGDLDRNEVELIKEINTEEALEGWISSFALLAATLRSSKRAVDTQHIQQKFKFP